MLNEKPNNNFHWKNKLEEIESLSGETFNKEAAWEKLHERMQGKSRNKKAVWYWAAAACLMLALLIPWFLSNKKESVLVKNNSGQNQIQSSPSHLLPFGNKNTSAVISSLLTEKKLPALSVEKSNKINYLFNHNIIQFKIVQDKKEKEEFITQKITNNAVVPVDTTISIVAILPVKKKFRVIHINELGNPVEDNVKNLRNNEWTTFQMKAANKDGFSNSSFLMRHQGDDILKIKLSPQN